MYRSHEFWGGESRHGIPPPSEAWMELQPRRVQADVAAQEVEARVDALVRKGNAA
jgi:hypothetical protein